VDIVAESAGLREPGGLEIARCAGGSAARFLAVAAPSITRGRPVTVTRHVRSNWLRARLRLGRSTAFNFGALAAGTAILVVLVLWLPNVFAVPWLLVPLLLGAWVLPTRWLIALAAIICVGRIVVGNLREGQGGFAIAVAYAILIGLVVLGARARSKLGTQGSRGESMLFDLRERLLVQGELPDLPPGWSAEVVHRSAHGESFGGDFLVSTVSTDGKLAEIALVDVSGKGIDAGTRALLLSGALGGLIGSVPPDRFLPAANLYLLRQRWEEGFATAVHVAVGLKSGEFSVGSAGHPPAVHYHAGSGEWEVLDASGPALGVLDRPLFDAHRGRMLPGDALLFYTDGLVETPDRDLELGIDRLLGMAERLVRGGFTSGARTLMSAVPDTASDDRACVLIWRS
jgi:hypothetical protein